MKAFWQGQKLLGSCILKTLEIKWCLDYNLEGCCNLQTHSSTFFLCGLKAFILLQEDWMAFSCPHISWLLCKSYLIHCTYSIDSIVIMEILYANQIYFSQTHPTIIPLTEHCYMICFTLYSNIWCMQSMLNWIPHLWYFC